MSYFAFLARFLVFPIIILALLAYWDQRRGKTLPATLQGYSPFAMLAILVTIALIYTTPWDNYLVATGVWWYNPQLVAGITLGWVPLEEYLFFVLQPILITLWVVFMAKRLPVPTSDDGSGESSGVRWLAAGVVGLLWLGSLFMLFGDYRPDTYLALELAWALPPIILQLAFGADILLRHWRLLLLTILPIVTYLSGADSLAITAGTWTIDPAQSFNLFLGGVLPIEELLFFLLTTLLVTLGLILGMAPESRTRLSFRWLSRKRPPNFSTSEKLLN